MIRKPPISGRAGDQRTVVRKKLLMPWVSSANTAQWHRTPAPRPGPCRSGAARGRPRPEREPVCGALAGLASDPTPGVSTSTTPASRRGHVPFTRTRATRRSLFGLPDQQEHPRQGESRCWSRSTSTTPRVRSISVWMSSSVIGRLPYTLQALIATAMPHPRVGQTGHEPLSSGRP